MELFKRNERVRYISTTHRADLKGKEALVMHNQMETSEDVMIEFMTGEKMLAYQGSIERIVAPKIGDYLAFGVEAVAGAEPLPADLLLLNAPSDTISRHLDIALKAMTRASTVLQTASETAGSEPFADECQAAAEDAVEGIQFLNLVQAQFPPAGEHPNVSRMKRATRNLDVAATKRRRLHVHDLGATWSNDMAAEGLYQALACELPGDDAPKGAAVFGADGFPYCFVSVDDVLGGTIAAAEARCWEIANALNSMIEAEPADLVADAERESAPRLEEDDFAALCAKFDQNFDNPQPTTAEKDAK